MGKVSVSFSNCVPWKDNKIVNMPLFVRYVYHCIVAEAEFKPTVWGRWGRKCSVTAGEGIQQTLFCLLSAQSPGSRSQETYTLQTNTHTHTHMNTIKTHEDEKTLCQFSRSKIRFLTSTWPLHTRHRVVHVEAVAFDVFQSQTSVDEDPETRHNDTAEACGQCPWETLGNDVTIGRLHQMVCPCRPVTSSLFLSFLHIQELCLHLDPFRPCCSFSSHPHCESVQLRWSWVEGGDVIIRLSPPLCQKASIFKGKKQNKEPRCTLTRLLCSLVKLCNQMLLLISDSLTEAYLQRLLSQRVRAPADNLAASSWFVSMLLLSIGAFFSWDQSGNSVSMQEHIRQKGAATGPSMCWFKSF